MSVFVLADRVAESTDTTGTGTLSLAGAVSNVYQTFVDGCGTGAIVPYVIVHRTAAQWEVGRGVITDGTPDTLTRVEVYANSSGGATPLNLSSGTKDVFLAVPADKTVVLDADTNALNLPGALVVAGALTVNGNTTLGNASGDTVTIVAGQTALPLGTAAAPSLAFTGDLNTGLFSPGADISATATGGTERNRTTAAGYFKASDSGTYNDATATYHELFNTVNGSPVAVLRHNGNSTPNGWFMTFANASPNNGTQYFALFADNAGGGTTRIGLYSNGGISNFSANNVNLSDERTKTDIRPLTSHWDTFKQFEIVEFKYRDQSHDDYNIGVIAQQVERVKPVLVDETPVGPQQDAGAPSLKGVYDADFNYMAHAVLQEAMARIEALEARLAAAGIA